MRLIDADALMDRMYHDAFETDTDMQKWDSGCWIRYKMFENAIDDAPIIDAVSVVRCGECKHRYVEEQSWGEYNEFCDFWCDGNGYWASVNADDFCSYGEVRDE